MATDERLTYKNGYCGIQCNHHGDMPRLLDLHLNSGFHFVVTPLMDPDYRPNLMEMGKRSSFAFAGMDSANSLKRSKRLVGKISSWIDLDSEDETLRKDSEIALIEEVDLASKHSLLVCLLPAPKSSSCGNYAKFVNQILQKLSNMQLMLRIPLEDSHDDCGVDNINRMGEMKTESLELWRSFCDSCELKFRNRLSVAFDFPRSLPSVNSLGRWSNEPVSAAFIDSNTLIEDQLMAWLFNHSVKIVLCGKPVVDIHHKIPGSKPDEDYSRHLDYFTIMHESFLHSVKDGSKSDDEDDFTFGTSLCAIKYDGGVVLGADSRNTRTRDAFPRDNSIKQFWIGGHICMAFAGATKAGLEIVYKLREKFKSAAATTISLVADWASEMLANVEDVHIIIVGTGKEGCEIYKVLQNEKSDDINIAMVGGAAPDAIVVPKGKKMTREKAKENVFRAIRRAKVHAYTTGGAINLVFIDTNGSVQTEVAWPEYSESSLTLHEWRFNTFTPDGYPSNQLQPRT